MKTRKRDDVRVTPLPGAAIVTVLGLGLGLAAGCVTDDNTVHPHSALRTRPPAEFRDALHPSRTVR